MPGAPRLRAPSSRGGVLGKRTRWPEASSGAAILWLDGFYSGRAVLTELPAGWVQTVSQGIGGTCAITVNARRTVLDVIGQLHREYGS